MMSQKGFILVQIHKKFASLMKYVNKERKSTDFG